MLKQAQLRLGNPGKLFLNHACIVPPSDMVPEQYKEHRFECRFIGSAVQANLTLETFIGPFTSFRDDLAQIDKVLSGRTKLRTSGADLTLETEIDKLGHAKWSGLLRHPGDIPEERLEFCIDDDQTSLSRVIGELTAIIADAQGET
jgi:hypothetical protein